MTEQKKGAQTAATVRSAKTTYQEQFTPNSEKTQAMTGLEFPMDADRTIAYLENQLGKMSSELKQFWRQGVVPMENYDYERGKKGLPSDIGDLVAANRELNHEKADPDSEGPLRAIMALEKKAYEAGYKEYCESLSLPYRGGESHD